ncbi:MAG: hypothetical protein ACI9I0_000559 [Rhodoferax sp.]|jgi:hypothetical protein
MRLPPTFAAVPERYHGVWARTLLETPEGRDTTTWVRWLQTSLWHADLRVAVDLDRRQPTGLAQQQGFWGITQITPARGKDAELCTWHRHQDFQPPRRTPDAGTMVFETPDRVIERGVHGNYLEVWERLPESLGRQIVLERLSANGQTNFERLLIAGDCFMHVRPRSALWPADLQDNDTLAEVIQRHPDQALALLDVDISFGRLAPNGAGTIERAILPALEGHPLDAKPEQVSASTAHIAHGRLAGPWRITEWRDQGAKSSY